MAAASFARLYKLSSVCVAAMLLKEMEEYFSSTPIYSNLEKSRETGILVLWIYICSLKGQICYMYMQLEILYMVIDWIIIDLKVCEEQEL